VEVPLVALRICELASGGYRGWRQMYLNLALEGARGAPRSQQLFNSCTAHGGKAWDHSGMVRALEPMASHQIAKG
jgi:hypothetical protein